MNYISADIKNNEFKLLKIVLIFSLVFWTLGILKGLWFNGDHAILVLDSISFIISAALLIGVRQGMNADLAARYYCLTWFPMFVCYWKYLGGMEGAITYIFFTLLVLFLGLLQSKARLFMAIGLCLINLILTLDADSQILLTVASMEKLINPLSINYLLNSAIVAAVVVFIKVRFDKERENLENHNQYLDQINQELLLKNELLSNQQLQIKTIQNNLEELVHEHTLELENRNKELEGYAYDNAHVVRRPLSNILSLIEILKQEDQKGMSENQLKAIREKAIELDQVVRKINIILD